MINKLEGGQLETKVNEFIEELMGILEESRLPQSKGHAALTYEAVCDQHYSYQGDLEMKIAAIAHDLSDCKEEWRAEFKDCPDYRERKIQHAQKAAELVIGMMKERGFPEDMIARVGHLVSNHEYGVDRSTMALMTGEVVSFFKHNLPFYIEQDGVEGALMKAGAMLRKLPTDKVAHVGTVVFEDKNLTEKEYFGPFNDLWSDIIVNRGWDTDPMKVGLLDSARREEDALVIGRGDLMDVRFPIKVAIFESFGDRSSFAVVRLGADKSFDYSGVAERVDLPRFEVLPLTKEDVGRANTLDGVFADLKAKVWDCGLKLLIGEEEDIGFEDRAAFADMDTEELPVDILGGLDDKDDQSS